MQLSDGSNFFYKDIVLHCAFIAYTKHVKKVDKNADISKVEALCERLDGFYKSLTDTIIDNDPKHILLVYNKQIDTKFRTLLNFSASSIKVQHQLQLGLLDVLIERQFYLQIHAYVFLFSSKKKTNQLLTLDILLAISSGILKLLEKYGEMSTLISIEIENLMSPIITPKSLVQVKMPKNQPSRITSVKKKLFTGTDENRNNKENSHRSPPTTSILNTALGRSHTSPSKIKSPVQTVFFANMKFEHFHRISYSSLLTMLRTCISCNGDHHTDELIDDDKLDGLIDLINSSSFIDYLEQNVETKLAELNKARNIQAIFVYDTESLDSNKRLEFLTSLFE